MEPRPHPTWVPSPDLCLHCLSLPQQGLGDPGGLHPREADWGFPSPALPLNLLPSWLPLSEGPSLTVGWQWPPPPSSCRLLRGVGYRVEGSALTVFPPSSPRLVHGLPQKPQTLFCRAGLFHFIYGEIEAQRSKVTCLSLPHKSAAASALHQPGERDGRWSAWGLKASARRIKAPAPAKARGLGAQAQTKQTSA